MQTMRVGPSLWVKVQILLVSLLIKMGLQGLKNLKSQTVPLSRPIVKGLSVLSVTLLMSE